MIETVGERELDWTAFLACLPAEDYRYAVFDLEFTTGDGLHHKKPFFCFWAPDAAPLKNRMLYATAKENFKAELDTLGKDITLCSKDEVPLPLPSSTSSSSARSSTSDSDSCISTHLSLSPAPTLTLTL